MNYKNWNTEKAAECTDVDIPLLMAGLHELLAGVHHALDSLHANECEDMPVLMVASVPGTPVQIVTAEEAAQILPCFGEDDVIVEAPDTSLLMSYDHRHVLTLGEEQYLIGSAILYAVDDEGEDIMLDAQDIYDARCMIERRTVTLCADGQDFQAIRLR